MISKTPHNYLRAWQLLLLLCITMLGLASCSSDKVIEQVEEEEVSADPMRFTCNVQENISTTRAAYLQDDFIISTYKSYKSASQQTVMDTYRVKHTTTGTDWDGNVKDNWSYVGVDGQIERYWDYNSFPYRFNAIAPYPADKSKVVLTDTQVEINAPYKMQTWSDGVKTNDDDRDAEPYWLAQVQRAADGKDKDIIANSEIASSSTTLNRYVALPFHHLNSKIRFAIYTTSPWATAHPMYIENLSIKVASDNFVTGAGKYTASGETWYNGNGTSGFTDLTTSNSTGTELLHYSGVDADNKPLAGNDLSQWQSKATAFWFDAKAKDGLMQIPQEGVKMTLSMNLYLIDGDDILVLPLQDVPVKLALEGETPTENHHWKSGNIYTYYIILENIGEHLEITFTATLAPWEDLSGSLETDLEQ